MRPLVLSACLLCLCCWATPVSAENATPIKVSVSISSENLQRAWVNKHDAIEKGLAAFVAKILTDRFDHWDFGTKFPKSYANIELEIRESPPRTVYFEMHKVRGDKELLWRQEWLNQTDFIMGRRPRVEDAESTLSAKFEEFFNQQRQRIVEDWLHEIPLGAHGQWQVHTNSQGVRVITSLRWERFNRLERSRFKVSCKRNEQEIEFETEGVKQPQLFEAASGHQFNALVMKLKDAPGGRIAGIELADVTNFKVGLIFLLEEREPVDDDFFDL